MIELKDIKPFPCLPGATVVAVDAGGGNGTPGGETSSSLEMRATETHIQWRVTDGAWTDLISLSSITGTPGPSVELQASESHIQWRVSGGEWANLIAISAITGPAGSGGGSALTPFIAYVSTAGNDTTGEIGDPSKPFATAQAACTAIEASAAGLYSLRLGVGGFGGITYTNALSARLSAISGEGANVSFLGGINAAGAPGAFGDPDLNADGQPGGNGYSVTLIGDGTVNLGDIFLSGGDGGAGVITTDGEIGGSGGPGGAAGDLSLERFTVGSITAHGGTGGSSAFGMSSTGNGGNGGDIGALRLHHCFASTIESSAGPGGSGSGMMDGQSGSITAALEIAWCRYQALNNPADQATVSGSFIWASIATQLGNASTVDGLTLI